MRIALLKANTNEDFPHSVERVIDNIVESDADVFVGPDNLFCGNYVPKDALAMIKYIGLQTRHLNTLIFPGTFTLKNAKEPVLPIIHKGKFVGLHEKYKENQPRAYDFNGTSYALSICSELGASNPEVDGHVDLHVLSTCGVYPSLADCHEANFRARSDGHILWTDGCKPETAVFKRHGLIEVPESAEVLDTRIYEIDLYTK